MTSFLNQSIQKRKVKFTTKAYKKIWFEIDSFKDLTIASKALK